MASVISQLLRILCGGPSTSTGEGRRRPQQQQQQQPQQQQQEHQQQQGSYPPQPLSQAQQQEHQQQQGSYPPQPLSQAQQQQYQQQQPYPPQQRYAPQQQGPQQQYPQQQGPSQLPPLTEQPLTSPTSGQHPNQQNQNQNHHDQHNQHHPHNQRNQQNHNRQDRPFHQQNGDAQNHQAAWNGTALPAGGVVGPHHPHYQNQDLVNSTNERYTDLRGTARHEGHEAHRCFAQSQDAYQSGDGARAHELSLEGKEHQKRQDELDDQASGWIFDENNRQSPSDTIDLHGLYVKEAIERTEGAIVAAQRSGQTELRVIVGKGIHSQGHVAKIKPAVEELMQKYNLSAHVDPSNTGVLLVDLTGQQSDGRTRDAGGLVDQMERQQGGDCVIM